MKMKNRILSIIVSAVLLVSAIAVAPIGAAASSGPVVTFDPINGFLVDQHALFDTPDIKYEPGSRWWLPEGVSTDESLRNSVQTLHAMGVSQIEIVCMPEATVDSNYIVTADPAAPAGVTWQPGTTSRLTYSWGSEEWIHDQRVVIEEATRLNMGFSLTSGTHWANANLPMSTLMPDDDGAGKSLSYTISVVQPHTTFDAMLPRTSISNAVIHRQDLERVVAIKVADSNTGTINASNQISGTMTYAEQAGVDLSSQVQVSGNGYLNWGAPLSAPNSNKSIRTTGADFDRQFWLHWTNDSDSVVHIYSYWLQPTGQSPTPSATSNYTINYIDKAGMDIFIDYYKNIFFADPALVDLVKQNGKGEMYMDSLEISSTNGFGFWGFEFLDIFKQNRGYDLTPYMPYIIKNGGGRSAAFMTRREGSDGVTEAKVRGDFYETMNDCYRDNILKPLQEYLHDELNMKLRAEITYGVNYEITTPTQYVDYTETESLEMKNCIDSFRVQAGGAHVWGLRLSSETGALSGSQYTYAQDRFMQVVNTQFASGVSFTVWHGYSNEEGADRLNFNGNQGVWTNTYWPGHEGMQTQFSERWGPRQPAFQHYDDYMASLARSQAILQQGIPQMDIGILHTDYNYNNSGATRASSDSLLGLPAGTYDPTRDNRGLYWQDMSLQNNGYTYDYFAPRNLTLVKETGATAMIRDGVLLPDRAGYQALIVYQDAMEISSAQTLLDLAKDGLPILFVNNVYTDNVNNNTIVPANDTQTNPSGIVIAASRTLSLSESDADLKVVVDQIKALPNVITLDGPAFHGENYDPANPYTSDVLEALHELGVYPRTQLGQDGADGIKNIYTFMRQTDDAAYVFTYNAVDYFDYNGVPMPDAQNGATTFDMSVGVAGKPYMIDTWTSEITEIAEYTIEDGRTSFSVTLKPGATAYFALDVNDPGDEMHAVSTDADRLELSNGELTVYAAESGTYTTTLSSGLEITTKIAAPELNLKLGDWSLVVDSFTGGEYLGGEKISIIENRGLGYITQEAWYPTKHTLLGPVQLAELKPWKDIGVAGIGQNVVGVGYYTTTFSLPGDWDATKQGAYLDVADFCGNTGQVFINGVKNTDIPPILTNTSLSTRYYRAPEMAGKVKGFDFIARKIDISKYLKPGENTITISVASTLLNITRTISQLTGTNYGSINTAYTNRQAYRDPAASASNPWQSYGLMGDVTIETFGIASQNIEKILLADIEGDATVGLNSPVSYTVSLSNMNDVGVVTLSFTADSRYLDLTTATPLNGFTFAPGGGLSWEYIGGQMWKGTVKLVYTGFISGDGPLAALEISGVTLNLLGETTVTLTEFGATGGLYGFSSELPTLIRTPEAKTTIVTKTVFSKYDLNHDGKIDELDLAIVVFYYQANDLEADWEVVKFDIASAKDCDVALNGRVDLADMIEVIANYCDSY
ncbi:MAG: hypothetical protein FWH55_07105 [Oscillospiraceae bacterium]|nr:hypothetical protein [Oscillospiraceae bacterium]